MPIAPAGDLALGLKPDSCWICAVKTFWSLSVACLIAAALASSWNDGPIRALALL